MSWLPKKTSPLRDEVLSRLSLAREQLPTLQSVWSRPLVDVPSATSTIPVTASPTGGHPGKDNARSPAGGSRGTSSSGRPSVEPGQLWRPAEAFSPDRTLLALFKTSDTDPQGACRGTRTADGGENPPPA